LFKKVNLITHKSCFTSTSINFDFGGATSNVVSIILPIILHL